MPELPEVETICRRLEPVLAGQHISAVSVRTAKSWSGDSESIVGLKITRVSRRAKMILLHLSDMRTLLVHLKMTGQLLYEHQGKRTGGGHPTSDWVATLPSKATHIIFSLADGAHLYFNDSRLFGWIHLLNAKQLEAALAPYGRDYTDPSVMAEQFWAATHSKRRAIKSLLLDQHIFAGVGNIYACEALFHAKVHPERSSESLTRTETDVILSNVRNVLQTAIQFEGTSHDQGFAKVVGLAGKYQDQLCVYRRAGLPCIKCNTPISSVVQSGRSSYCCVTCQK